MSKDHQVARPLLLRKEGCRGCYVAHILEGGVQNKDRRKLDCPHYRAFVSYCHGGKDEQVATYVQRSLEAFRVPRDLRSSFGASRMGPVFRDVDELSASSSLNSEIEAALKSSDALVVVCSPRTQKSVWVQHEVEFFLSCHDRSRAFVVLAEGDPSDVVPEQLLLEKRYLRDSDGNERVIQLDVEPLACDFRTSDELSWRSELTRLAAGILEVGYDALVQRARRQRLQAVASTLGLVLAAALFFLAYVLYSNGRLNESYRQLQMQQSRYLSTEAADALGAGDRLKAIELACEALPQSGEDRPIVPEAVRVLTEATSTYRNMVAANEWRSAGLVSKYYSPADVEWVALSDDERLIAASDVTGNVRVWDLIDNRQLLTTSRRSNALDECCPIVITEDNRLIVVDSFIEYGQECEIRCLDIDTGKTLWVKEPSQVVNAYTKSNGSLSEFWILSKDCAVAFAEGHAYLIDLREADVVSDVAVPEESAPLADIGKVVDGWHESTKQLVINLYDDERNAYEVYLIDFLTNHAQKLNIGGMNTDVYASSFLGDGTILCSSSDGANWSNGVISIGYDETRTMQKRYKRILSRSRADGAGDLWATCVDVYLPSVARGFYSLGSHIPGFEDRDVEVYYDANIIVLLDSDTGELLQRYETPSPICVIQPVKNESDSDNAHSTLLKGALLDGSAFALAEMPAYSSGSTAKRINISYGIIATTKQYVDLHDSYKKNSGFIPYANGVIAFYRDTIYQYADVPEAHEVDRFILSESQDASQWYATACGMLSICEMQEDGSESTSMALSMFDASDGTILWSTTYDFIADGYHTRHVLTDPSGQNYVVLSLPVSSEDSENESKVVVVDLKDGSESFYVTSSTLTQSGDLCWHGIDGHAFLSENPLDIQECYVVSYELVHDDHTASHQKANKLLVCTDLRTGAGIILRLSDIRGHTELLDDGLYDGDNNWSLSPTGENVIVQTEMAALGDEASNKTRVVSCALLNMKTQTITPLPAPIRPHLLGSGTHATACALWSESGDLFACSTTEDVLVFDAQGRLKLSIPHGGSQLLSLHFQNDALLMACKEESHITLMAFSVSTGDMIGQQSILQDALEVYSDSPADYRWIAATSGNHDLGDVCLIIQGQCAVLLSLDPFGICQVVGNAVAYDDATRTFITVESGKDGIWRYFACRRCTIDDLVERGREQVHAAGMSDKERRAFGFSIN